MVRKLAVLGILAGIILIILAPLAVFAQDAAAPAAAPGDRQIDKYDNKGMVLALSGAALAVFLSGIGSAIGICTAGSAASGLMTEQPEKAGKLLVLVAMPGTQGVYGFLAGVLVLRGLGFFGEAVLAPENFTYLTGMWIFAACLAVSFACVVSAIFQGRVCAAGVGILAKQEAQFIQGVIYAAMVEFYAILGLLGSILMFVGIGLL